MFDIFESLAVNTWYNPFMIETSSNLSLDPWQVWLVQGNPSFPLRVHDVVCSCLLLLYLIYLVSGSFAYFMTLFLADILLCLVLFKLLPNKTNLVLNILLSPIIIVATYALGLNDLIPVLILLFSVLFLKDKKFILSSSMLVLAISAKLMLIALPFF